jgi:hypothetical protein
MKLDYGPSNERGVTSLMYVGDDGIPVIDVPISERTLFGYREVPLLVACAGAALAFFGKKMTTKAIGTVVAIVAWDKAGGKI